MTTDLIRCVPSLPFSNFLRSPLSLTPNFSHPLVSFRPLLAAGGSKSVWPRRLLWHDMGFSATVSTFAELQVKSLAFTIRQFFEGGGSALGVKCLLISRPVLSDCHPASSYYRPARSTFVMQMRSVTRMRGVAAANRTSFLSPWWIFIASSCARLPARRVCRDYSILSPCGYGRRFSDAHATWHNLLSSA